VVIVLLPGEALYKHRYIGRELVHFFRDESHWFGSINILGLFFWIPKFTGNMVSLIHLSENIKKLDSNISRNLTLENSHFYFKAACLKSFFFL
jgi:hypothetical protein